MEGQGGGQGAERKVAAAECLTRGVASLRSGMGGVAGGDFVGAGLGGRIEEVGGQRQGGRGQAAADGSAGADSAGGGSADADDPETPQDGSSGTP